MTEYLLQKVLLRNNSKSPAAGQGGVFENFLAHCHRRRYPAKAEVFRPGDPAATLYYVLSGTLSVIAEDESGQELVLTYINPGDFIGEMGVFMQSGKREVILRARSAAELAEIDYSRLHALLAGPLARDCGPLMWAIVKQLSRRLLQSNRKAGRLAFLDVSNRIGRTLLDLCREPDAEPHPQGTQLRLSTVELARVAGCSREQAGRVLKKFSADGLIDMRGKTILVYHGH